MKLALEFSSYTNIKRIGLIIEQTEQKIKTIGANE